MTSHMAIDYYLSDSGAVSVKCGCATVFVSFKGNVR